MTALNGQTIGTILWWSDRDENGIILDDQGNEYYFDRSTWKGNLKPVRKQLLKFTTSKLSCGTNVAKEVTDLLG